jgi:HEAT repeat protein
MERGHSVVVAEDMHAEPTVEGVSQMWKCYNCNETVEDNLDICWNCGYGKDGGPPADRTAFSDEKRELAVTETKVLRGENVVASGTEQGNSSADMTSWAKTGAVSSAILTGLSLLFLWAIPQFTSSQVWTIDISTASVSIPLRLLGLWNGIVALAYFGLVPGLSGKNLESYKHALQLAQLNLFLTYFQTTQYGQVSLSDIFILGGNFSLLMATWGGKQLIAQERMRPRPSWKSHEIQPQANFPRATREALPAAGGEQSSRDEIARQSVQPAQYTAKNIHSVMRQAEELILSKGTDEAIEFYSQETGLTRRVAAQAVENIRRGLTRDGRILPAEVMETKQAVDPGSITTFVTGLHDVDENMRSRALSSLVAIGRPAVGPLLTLLEEKDPARGPAIEALGQIGDAKAVDPIISCLTDRDMNVRLAAASALGRLKDVRAARPLFAALVNPGEAAQVRMHAAKSLGNIGGTEVEGLLESALADQNYRVWMSAAFALGQTHNRFAIESLINDLRKANFTEPWKSLRAAEILTAVGKPAVEPLLRALHDSNSMVRGRAAFVLGKIGDSRAVDELIARLADSREQSSVRQTVAEALGEISSPGGANILTQSLGDPDPEVRWSAAYSLGIIGDAQALAELDRVAREDKGKTGRSINIAETARGAAEKIRQRISYRERSNAEWLVDLTSANREIQLKAIQALGYLKELRALGPTIKVLRNSDAEMRLCAAQALGEIGDPRGVDPLVDALGDIDDVVRMASVRALEAIGDLRALGALQRISKTERGKKGIGDVLAGMADDAMKNIWRKYLWALDDSK